MMHVHCQLTLFSGMYTALKPLAALMELLNANKDQFVNEAGGIRLAVIAKPVVPALGVTGALYHDPVPAGVGL